MATLEQRVIKLESAALNVDLHSLTNAELRDHIATLPFKSSKQYGAIITLILRHGSAFPVMQDDPAHKVECGR